MALSPSRCILGFQEGGMGSMKRRRQIPLVVNQQIRPFNTQLTYTILARNEKIHFSYQNSVITYNIYSHDWSEEHYNNHTVQQIQKPIQISNSDNKTKQIKLNKNKKGKKKLIA